MGNMKQTLSRWKMPLTALSGRGMRNLERLLEGGSICIGSDRGKWRGFSRINEEGGKCWVQLRH